MGGAAVEDWEEDGDALSELSSFSLLKGFI
jgi:hypothetical protein